MLERKGTTKRVVWDVFHIVCVCVCEEYFRCMRKDRRA